MVEQRVAVQDRSSRGSRVLALLLTLGGALVLWTLMTGTAHAAEAPGTPEPAPVVTHLTHTAKTLTTTVTTPVQRTVKQTVKQTRHTVPESVRQTVHETAQQTRAAVSPVRDVVTGSRVPRPSQLVRPVRVHHAKPAPTSALDTTVTTVTAATTTTAQGGSTAPRPVTAPTLGTHRAGAVHHGPHRPFAPHRADAPEGSSGQPGPNGGAGPPGFALVEHLSTPDLLASSEHSADVAPDPPAEPAYPPGCSPD